MILDRRQVLSLLGCAAIAATGLSSTAVAGEQAARAEAVALGLDPDEVVSYGPPLFAGDSDPVDREARIWMLLDETTRARLP